MNPKMRIERRPQYLMLWLFVAVMAGSRCESESSSPKQDTAANINMDMTPNSDSKAFDSSILSKEDMTPNTDSKPFDSGILHKEVGTSKDITLTKAKVGDPCGKTTECEKGGSGIATCRETWPSGYCLVEGCSTSAMDCPDDPGMGKIAIGAAKCVLAPTPTCLKMCGVVTDCRSGYKCVGKADAMGHGDVKVCVPQ